ncbi:glycosyltransferase family 2 protein [Leptospira gomenensis]|uniref:Glycosyltransferase family 2 protein n=1 Tax=Leptospira gomenensis TaxID=2484974 RepID=A0A5F1YGT9_9LEPT|nr:glycosyltransferase family A protein [Leptospira gomenensis]TGK31539.1 glycosyltransferase family 2 protein [Leptospira gomenensis]TGK44189.1 glycosyltransferase family 2 protein [Leptospira gomenensis]TGK46244.1 glycosyltransferase family 2 protein [Leptospira gomenensis]TGK54769.1 glycosyltransferase family 2 protein [Leptospira gomenensis]
MRSVPVTVVIPTYNRADSICAALESVFSQTVFPEEILIVDDGSDDETVFVLNEKFREQRDKFRILSLEHGGVSRARNRGVQNANQDWIAFLDSDDVWLPQKLERQWDTIQEEGGEILQTQEIWIRNGRRINPPVHLLKKNGDIFDLSLEFCAITPSSVLLKKELYQNAGGMDESLPACEDYDLWLRITARHPVRLLDELLLIRYAGHEDQLSFRYPVMDRFRIYSILKLLNSDLLNDIQRKSAERILFIKWNILKQGRVKRNLWNESDDLLLSRVLENGFDSSFGFALKRFLLQEETWSKG